MKVSGQNAVCNYFCPGDVSVDCNTADENLKIIFSSEQYFLRVIADMIYFSSLHGVPSDLLIDFANLRLKLVEAMRKGKKLAM